MFEVPFDRFLIGKAWILKVFQGFDRQAGSSLKNP